MDQSTPTTASVSFNKQYYGLSTEEAEKLLKEQGPNKLPENPPPSAIYIFLSQLKSPLVYILLIAAAVNFALHGITDTIIILLAVAINTILGFIQEERAGKALEALKKLIHPIATVIRNGNIVKIDAENLVRDDLIVLSQGDKISADGKIVEANRLFISEAVLTGESVPVAKKEEDKVYMGTAVTAGRAVMKVETTGAGTEIGRIAESVQGTGDDTPLRRQLSKFSKDLSVFVFAITTLVFVLGIFFGMDPVEIFTTSVALAVAAIPEGLLVGLTVILAIGMQRILKRKGLVRNLASAETLGGVTTICTDKTGTLTLGKMQVAESIGNEKALLVQAFIANDMSDPLEIAASEWSAENYEGINPHEDANSLISKHHRLDSIPFTSEERFFASLNSFDDASNMLFVNGAPEFLLEWSDLDKKRKQEILKTIEELSEQGKRLVGYAQKKVDKSVNHIEAENVKNSLEWVGLLAFSDPVRPDVKKALAKTKEAGIKLIIITGDYAKTAIAVLKELDLDVDDEAILLGEHLENMNNKDLAEWFKDDKYVRLFARTKPEQKFRIVESLKQNGEVVAMLGDGVNDAPALAKADIGIVVNEATDVAKESADLVLLDSSFSVIVAAIEEGRGIFDNIRKVILYLMSDAFGEIIAIMLALSASLPLPVTASQILWINIVSDGFPSLALTVDPRAKGIMNQPPRPPSDRLVAPWMRKLILIVSLAGGLVAFLLFAFVHYTTGDDILARSVAFATLGMNSLVYVFSVKTLREPFWKENIFANRWLVIAVIAGTVLQVVPFMFDFSREFLKLESLGNYWFVVFGASFFMFFVIEVSKWVFGKRLV